MLPPVESDRRRRLAQNEQTMHAANEQIERAAAEMDELSIFDPGPLTFFCACGRSRCDATVDVLFSEYERIHRLPNRYLIAPGHEQPEIERVVETHEKYLVVEKLPPYSGTESD